MTSRRSSYQSFTTNRKMKLILILSMFSIVLARPDGSSGYDYNSNPYENSNDYAESSQQAPVQAAQINKQYYLHSAPEDEDEETDKHFTLGKSQKNYRVVFVKTPTRDAVRFAAEYAPQEEKTVIYVLAQNEHEIDPSDIATPAPTLPSKPEVVFIKYRTPEEAEQAQRDIQAQYDALGGSSQFSDEGTAPINSVIGTFNTTPRLSGNGYLPPNQNNYLPPLKL